MRVVSANKVSSSWIALDGCPSGWVASWVVQKKVYISFVDSLTNLSDVSLNTIYIDVPVVLPSSIDNYPRKEDVYAKKVLGKYHSSIFHAPLKSWLDRSYENINSECEDNLKPKLSKQSYAIFKNIRQVQQLINQSEFKILEIHPELLVHYFLKNQKLSKKSLPGHLQRIQIINRFFKHNYELSDIKKGILTLRNKFKICKVNIDDILDVIITACIVNEVNRLKRTQDITSSDKQLINRLLFFKS